MIPLFILIMENDDDRKLIEHIYKEYYNLMYKKAFDILEKKDYIDDVINDACIKLISQIQTKNKLFSKNVLRFGLLNRFIL